MKSDSPTEAALRVRRSREGAGTLGRDHADRLTLLVVIPAFNEETTVGGVVRLVPSDIPSVSSVIVLVVDDGSSDATAQEAKSAGAEVISHPRNWGVGAAIQTGLAYGIDQRADLVVTMDADGQFDPATIPDLIAPVAAGSADFSTASRFKDRRITPKMPRVKLWGNRGMSWLISRLTGERFYDVSCGMRCYNRSAALKMNLLAAFTYTQEAFLSLAMKRLRMIEVPIQVRGEREFGESKVAKSVWKYGFKTAQIIFRSYRDYYPLRFFGSLAAVLLTAAAALGIFFLFHYLKTGNFYPHTWAGFTAGAFAGFAVLLIHLGITGDMLNRHRVYLEELLSRVRGDALADARKTRHVSDEGP